MFRIPSEVREGVAEVLRDRTSHSTGGVEFRFVINSGTAKVTLRTTGALPTDTPGKQGILVLYYGGIQSGSKTSTYLYTDDPTTIEIEPPSNLPDLEKLTLLNGYPYSPQVVRLIFSGAPAVIIDIEGDIRPPEEEELPVLRGLMYGSSITHGSASLIANHSFAATVGRRLKADICNLGFSGSCQMEEAMADYIASRSDCDFFFSELGINVMWYMKEEEFERRVRYYIETAANAHTGKYFVVTDLFYCHEDLRNPARVNAFRDIVRRVCEESECANVHYINGLDLLTSSSGLTGDLVHPNVDGMTEISRNLTEKLKEIMNM
jgi:hypothetical protein